MMAGIPAFMAKVAQIVCRRIYEKLNASPMPRYIPIPPLRFRALRLAPIMVRINEAKQEDFEQLPGIGPSIAKKIIEYREQNGKFTAIDELQEVKGIGEAKLENIKEYITVK